jgi:putative ABC transport system substrate-binding protein
LTNVGEELGGKQLELLKEIVPRLSRVAVLTRQGVLTDVFLKVTEVSARAMDIQLIPVSFRGPEDFEDAIRSAIKQRAHGLIERLGPGTSASDSKRAVGLTVKNRLPAISGRTNWVDAGGLISYGPDRNMTYRRAATYVDKILKGTKPADLPIEAPMKFELVINLQNAKQIGLTIPPNVLARADKVIK